MYFFTTSRSVPTGDSGELIASAWTLGVAHSPGYPTFTMLSHLAGYLPFGTPAFRLNLLSALLDAVAIGVLSLGAMRLLQFGSRKSYVNAEWLIPITGIIAGIGLLAVSNVFWLYATIAEVFALNNLLAAITLIMMLEWVHRPSQRSALWLCALFSGLGMTNQHTFVLLAPGLITLLVYGLIKWRRGVRSNALTPKAKRQDPGWRIRDLSIGAGLFVIGLLPYLYLPLAASADPMINFGDPSSLNNFWRVLIRADYGTFSLSASEIQGDRLQQLYFIGKYFFQSFTPVGIGLAILGIIWFWRRKPVEGIGLGLVFLFSGPLFAVYANPPLQQPLVQGIFERFYILPSIPFAIFVTTGSVFFVELFAGLVARLKIAYFFRPANILWLIIAIVLVASIGVIRFPSLDMSNNRIAEDYGIDMLTSLEPNAILINTLDYNWTSTIYAQVVLGIRPDVAIISASMLPARWYVNQQQRVHPDVDIPFTFYDQGRTHSITDLVDANIAQRPIYGVGLFTEGDDFVEEMTGKYDIVYWGLAHRFVNNGEGTDPYVLMKPVISQFADYRFPDQAYPLTSWESLIAVQYGKLAYKLAFALQKQGEAQADTAYIEKMYRVAIFNAPEITASYKNLAILLKDNGSPQEIITLLEKYLELVPNAPDREDINSVIRILQE